MQHSEVQLLMQTLHLQAYIHVYNKLWSVLATQLNDLMNDTSVQQNPQTGDRNPLQIGVTTEQGIYFFNKINNMT